MARMTGVSAYFAVALGGALGATLRFAAGGVALRALGTGFPWGTILVNVVGSFVMGCLAALLMERVPGGLARFGPFLLTGVLGGFTTFSAFSLDALFLIERGKIGLAGLYVGASVALSIAALWAGLSLARSL